MSVDVLMVTYNRPAYTRVSLGHLLESCDESMRVWVWHNGNDRATLDVVESMRGHARFHEFHHSAENQRIRTPINWLFGTARGELGGDVLGIIPGENQSGGADIQRQDELIRVLLELRPDARER